MPELPPDPRAEIDARIKHFKKQTQKLNLEFLEAQEELARATQAVRQGASGQAPVAISGPTAAPMGATTPLRSGVVTVAAFSGGVGWALHTPNGELWFDTRDHAITYAREVFAECEVEVQLPDGTTVHVSQLES